MELWLLATLVTLLVAIQAVHCWPSFVNPRREGALLCKPAPVVKAPAGDFEGFWTESLYGRAIASFEGIPYARPPVGDLRFKIAQSIPKLINFKAKRPGSNCVQRDLLGWNNWVIGNEDCLYINVYVPEVNDPEQHGLLPVMVSVHGGGFVGGQGSDFKPTFLLDRDVIFVTFNYRLGPLGFLSTEDGVIPGNLGLKDQVAALQWVHDNIAAFGGNPNLVTVFGHSAGAVSTEYLMISPLTRGLLHRAIAMSGSTFAPWGLHPDGEAAEYRTKLAEYLKCPARPSEDLLDCLKKKSPQEIISVDLIFKKLNGILLVPSKPVIEGNITGAFLPFHPKKMFEKGLFNDVPFITGITSEEGSFISASLFNNDGLLRAFDEKYVQIAPDAIFHPKLTEERLQDVRKFYFGSLNPLNKSQVLNGSDLFTDSLFMWPMIQTERHRKVKAKTPIYIYFFSYGRERNYVPGLFKQYGVSHGDDLFYIFPIPGNRDGMDSVFSRVMVELYTTFARNGAPTSRIMDLNWKPVTSNGTDIEYFHLNNITDIDMKKDLLPKRWGFWDKLD